MKAKWIRINWAIPVVGIALLAGGVIAAGTYLSVERKIQGCEAFSVTLDRLYAGERLSSVLKTFQEGDASAARQRVDLLLCSEVLAANSRLASATDAERVYAQHIFAQIARKRPKTLVTTTGATQEVSGDQIEATRILTEACLAIKRPTEELAVLR
jgi:hypothetical protein